MLRDNTENEQAAESGGAIAGTTRKDIEKKLGRKVVTEENFLPSSKQKELRDK